MPFRDKEWEDFQRSCDFFPAYSDYLYDPDERLVVTQEPGLHPQIYPGLTFAPIQYTNSMPSRSYDTSENCQVQDSAASRRQSLRILISGHETLSGESSVRNTPGLDSRSEIGSPMVASKSRKGAQKISKKETKKRPRNAARRVAASPSSSQRPVRSTRQQAQTKQAPASAEPSLLRASSTTDVDDSFPPTPLAQSSTLPSATEMKQQEACVHARQLQQATGYPGSLRPTPEPSHHPHPHQSPRPSVEQPYYYTTRYPQQQMPPPPTTAYQPYTPPLSTNQQQIPLPPSTAYQPYTPPQSTSQQQMPPPRSPAYQLYTPPQSTSQQQMFPAQQQLVHNNATMQPRASLQLRQNINQHLPKVWKCLQIVQGMPVSANDQDAQKLRMQANEWLMMFKRSLPPDGHDYMMQVF
ncbi:hypothetical protein PtrV1_04635 [Pyrenophora tritici-repentis]|nr:hypothetical protein PtrV1_04635 [Pyrenophora tritici-repentis]KAI1563060.1 hypothetical protein PtrEW4_009611 [Pyrenophora tritici-repentis]KAI1571080.1 hypothetical protein PtrEW7m1_007986 [Pyrenophora tritici-repentis]KAI1583546.1 hypothetical protein PtrEW13061_008766 [Pyrenophora tritici-repentis]PZD25927.1 PAT1 multi-domain protein [Pyrenophora tritici-repentis]